MSPLSVPLVFSNLPVELLRDIFEHAAFSDRATARALTRVSSTVRRWTDPVLFHTVVLSTARDLRAFLTAIDNKPSEFVRMRVKHLGIFALGPVQSIDRVISACTGVRSLACGFSLPSYKQMRGCGTMQTLVRSREQHLLGLSCRDGWDAGLIAPAVTHLRIHITSHDARSPDTPFGFALGIGDADESGWERLMGLSALTHLAIVYRVSATTPAAAILPYLQQLLSPPTAPAAAHNPPELQLILVQVLGTPTDSSAAEAAAADINVAAVEAGGKSARIVAECAPVSVVRQWEDAVRVGSNIWEGAGAVVRARLAASTIRV
ncbi:hypothetical protein B0H21DRAFT_777793 [Amylocystis lapponica]|nr:hypothetical protein B0H21DRAFT_777793 [Amylocystis lapponica]